MSYVKMQQVSAETSSLLGCYAEGSNILCKDAASECRNVKLAWMLCRGQQYFMQRYTNS